MSPAGGDTPPTADGFRIPDEAVGARVDVLRYPGEDDGEARYRGVPAGEGAGTVAERENAAKRQWFTTQSTVWWGLLGLAPLSLFGTLAESVGLPYVTGLLWLAVVAALRWWYDTADPRESTPELVAEDVPAATARREFDAALDDGVDAALDSVTATVESRPSQSSTSSSSSTVASRSSGESTTKSALERSTDSSAPE
ncbi:hypothetical protein [Haloarchaeobius amylolyticus]|uniref:hypothetical protein n=1 Tax=Haloarchaeobius amylolyticus TaxID=1198296 RepID=UPI0022716706|nr:hypothetical protein [Haloarchaeobius amylolyticus]